MKRKNASKQTTSLPPSANPTTGQASSALLTRDHVARKLHVCRHTVAKYTRTGRLPCVVINARVLRYREQDVDAFIRESLYRPSQEAYGMP
jgi:hypothetical protein